MVRADSIGQAGRMVKCGKCSHIWLQEPSEIIKEVVEKSAAQASHSPPKYKVPARIPSGKYLMPACIAAGVLAFTLIISSMLLLRDGVEQTMPFMKKVYSGIGFENTDLLVITDVIIDRSGEREAQKFLITGNVINHSEHDRNMPTLRYTAFGKNDIELETLESSDNDYKLKPGESRPFKQNVSTRNGFVKKIRIELGSTMELALRN